MKIFRKFFEWNAARSDQRFKLFRDAKQLYLNFLEANKSYGSIEHMPPEIAKNDQNLILAEEKFRESIRLAEVESAYQDAATSHFQLSFLYCVQGRYDEGIKELNQAIDIFNNVPNLDAAMKQTMRDCYYNIGLAGIFKKDMDIARKNLDIALSMNKAENDREGIRLVNEAIAQIRD